MRHLLKSGLIGLALAAIAFPVAADDEPESMKGMLQAHNDWRALGGQGKLEWSDALATASQAWADKLAADNCQLKHDPANKDGENLAWQSALISTRGRFRIPLDPADIADRWGAEVYDYDWTAEPPACKAGKVCGHYTQVVWGDTTKLGCGMALCTGTSDQNQIWVCRYNPPGNFVGEIPYQKSDDDFAVELGAQKDNALLRQTGFFSRNVGAEPTLVVATVPTQKWRSIVGFSAAVDAVKGNLIQGDVVMSVVNGITMNTVFAHPIAQQLTLPSNQRGYWVEGGGTFQNPGTGAGSTWSCGRDPDISNAVLACFLGDVLWAGASAGPLAFDRAAGVSQAIPAGTVGDVTWDVTDLIKTRGTSDWVFNDETSGGATLFASREFALAPPRLKLMLDKNYP